MRRLTLVVAVVAFVATCVPVSGQQSAARDRTLVPMRIGHENMRAEKFEEAARNFQQAIDIDESFEDAYYWLGRADMALKRYTEAIAAYSRARDLFRARAGRQFSNAQEAQRYRRDQITELDDQIEYLQKLPPTLQTQEQIRQLQEYKRKRQEDISRGNNMTIQNSVPAWISLALGSAYFRSGRMPDAEREYKAAIEADSKAGEAHQNLAVLYMTTQRYADAERSLEAAKRAGFKVNPALEEEIRAKRKG
jgi:tetratricopeptide (TPR) repeat protein